MEFTGERMIPEISPPNTFWEHVFRYKFALKYAKNKIVLDIASGEGYGTAALAAAGANNVIGIDISEEACEHARRKYGLDYRVGNAEVIPLDDNSIDTIVSFETIEHLDNPETFLRECARILKHNGEIILSTPNPDAYLVYKENEFHKILFTLEQMLQLLEKRFFDIRVFSQSPETISSISLRSLASLRSPLQKYHRYRKLVRMLRNLFCSDVFVHEKIDYFKNRPIEAITKRDHFYDYLINPYKVTKLRFYEDEIPMFYIFVAKVKKQK